MKKKYTKPNLLIENFSLSQSIATYCGSTAGGTSTLGKTNHSDPPACQWVIGSETIWSNNCSIYMLPIFNSEVEYEGKVFCYNQPEGATVIFSS